MGEKFNELQEKTESTVKELSNELKGQTAENKRLREADRQEWQGAITNTCLLYTSRIIIWNLGPEANKIRL